jgi:hypothetical protein
LLSFAALAKAEDTPRSVQLIVNSIDAAAQHLSEDVEIDLGDDPAYAEIEAQASDLVARARHLRKAALKGASPDHLRADIQKVGVALTQLQGSLAEIDGALHLDRTAEEVGRMLDQLNREVTPDSQAPAAPPRSAPSESVGQYSNGRHGLPKRPVTRCPQCPNLGPPCRMEPQQFNDAFLDEEFLPTPRQNRPPQRRPMPNRNAPVVPQPPAREQSRIVVPKDMKGVALLPREEQPAALAQRTCPVTGELLGSHGKPIAVHLRNRTVYVCCEGCVSDVKSAPEKYLPKLTEPNG